MCAKPAVVSWLHISPRMQFNTKTIKHLYSLSTSLIPLTPGQRQDTSTAQNPRASYTFENVQKTQEK